MAQWLGAQSALEDNPSLDPSPPRTGSSQASVNPPSWDLTSLTSVDTHTHICMHTCTCTHKN